ncbi:hypothetical protein CASFOL_030944 [Castilleja foliolosa]|uniref:Uncharacterized protein n=1 Tax=Castilleja foliolosa TaxID=1961234 RepID=A0ABD3C6S0_9LAMI
MLINTAIELFAGTSEITVLSLRSRKSFYLWERLARTEVLSGLIRFAGRVPDSTRLLLVFCSFYCSYFSVCLPKFLYFVKELKSYTQNMRELYRLVLVDTPLAPYFSECITSEDLDDMNIEIMRNSTRVLTDFKLGGATAEIMFDLIAFDELTEGQSIISL